MEMLAEIGVALIFIVVWVLIGIHMSIESEIALVGATIYSRLIFKK